MVDIMTFEKNLQAKKADALAAYKAAKADFLKTVTSENLKGDFEKWKIFCSKKADCMKLGRKNLARLAVPGFDSPACFTL
jgi:hypothetical protein